MGVSLGLPTDGDAFLTNGLNLDSALIANTDFPDDDWKLGQTDLSEHVTANRWTLVKIHVDTSTASARYEAWMRPTGADWVKVVECIDGVTSGFTWQVHPDFIGGHRTFRMPSTFGQASPATRNYDAWIYMDDFAMATSEAALPTDPCRRRSSAPADRRERVTGPFEASRPRQDWISRRGHIEQGHPEAKPRSAPETHSRKKTNPAEGGECWWARQDLNL